MGGRIEKGALTISCNVDSRRVDPNSLDTVMVSFMCQFTWVKGYLDSR